MFFSFLNFFANFNNYINKISVKKLNIFIILYLDQILIYI